MSKDRLEWLSTPSHGEHAQTRTVRKKTREKDSNCRRCCFYKYNKSTIKLRLRLDQPRCQQQRKKKGVIGLFAGVVT